MREIQQYRSRDTSSRGCEDIAVGRYVLEIPIANVLDRPMNSKGCMFQGAIDSDSCVLRNPRKIALKRQVKEDFNDMCFSLF